MGLKVVLSGPTGFIGGEVLRQLLVHPDISAIVALSRREIPALSKDASSKEASDKVRTVVLKEHKDWVEPSAATRDAVAGADLTVWAAGTKLRTDLARETQRQIEVEWPLFWARLLSDTALPNGRPHRFVWLGGKLGERNQAASLWFAGQPRKLKGELETELEKLAASRPTTLSATITRPAAVYAKQSPPFWGGASAALGMGIQVDWLAAALIRAGTEEGTGGTGKVVRVMESAELATEGKRALKV